MEGGIEAVKLPLPSLVRDYVQLCMAKENNLASVRVSLAQQTDIQTHAAKVCSGSKCVRRAAYSRRLLFP